ncbi:ESCRT-1 complex, Vps28 subunit [Tilletiaria anomala UBC 951]|uniref:Vacuolar protein sorting-associated protein 28 n=1 Tax=Tilletiaria anomala (strain ATCC 24038 / CBS 436.72 / UBC 951) TaxID=1037660 RepID=A0A066WH82_TILAU|nr:ESCRT-1 complex, Vps28 subunit [Tilletiaria anomala UBC 951]KDN50404.1 ESCRT-1 complex, Vps28 subunit [Tilletiaria anomala UBC 951]
MSPAMMDVNLYEEARLYSTNAERERWENCATLFSLIVSLENLERAYVRGSVTEADYAPACTKMLAQSKTILNLITSEQSNSELPGGPPAISSAQDFMKFFRMDHPAASHRLLIGVPATVEHASAISNSSASERAKWVAELTQAWITLMDALKLKLRAKDQLHPLLSDLMSSYSKADEQGAGEGRARLLQWLISLNQMKASDELSEDQARQMLYEVESAYTNWFRALQG